MASYNEQGTENNFILIEDLPTNTENVKNWVKMRKPSMAEINDTERLAQLTDKLEGQTVPKYGAIELGAIAVAKAIVDWSLMNRATGQKIPITPAVLLHDIDPDDVDYLSTRYAELVTAAKKKQAEKDANTPKAALEGDEKKALLSN
jgi:hypothetical protein